MSRTCGSLSRSPVLRRSYFPLWLDVARPYKRFTNSLASFPLTSYGISFKGVASLLQYGVPLG